MLGDVLLISEGHRKAAAAILEYLLDLNGSKVVLAVGGESGSGKTEIAHVVAKTLKERGTPAKVMHIDNYYRTSPAERTAWRKQHGLAQVGYTEYDWEAINRNLEEFQKDEDRVEMPCIDLLTDQEDTLITSFKGLKYLIIEGLFAIQAEADLRVLIDLTYHETKKAQYQRGKEPTNDFRWQILEREHQVVQSLRPKADLLVKGDYSVVPYA
ncbi:MAG: uridine kinase [Anaerolineales bacterium]